LETAQKQGQGNHLFIHGFTASVVQLMVYF